MANKSDKEKFTKDGEVHELVGVAHGEEVVDTFGEATGEKVVYEFDDDGNFAGWHKESK